MIIYPPYHPIVYLHLNGKWSIIFYSNSLFVANIIKCDLTQVENKSPNLCRVWSWKIIILNINRHNFLRFHLFYIFMNLKNTVYEVKIINLQWYLCIMCVGLIFFFDHLSEEYFGKMVVCKFCDDLLWNQVF